MLRVAKSKYVGKRDKSLLKVKTFYDAEAKVVGYEPGRVRSLPTVSTVTRLDTEPRTISHTGQVRASRRIPHL